MVQHVTMALFLLVAASVTRAAKQEMDEMWGGEAPVRRGDEADRGRLFRDGNYAMFIHWGLYCQYANKVDGKTYYGIGEWIMNKRMAGIPVQRYMATAKEFNPTNYDAMAIARLARDAGMKYIVVTSKHHDGFAMYHSQCNAFNIVDATPFKRDPMKELAEACRKVGLGLGFYYSHNQDWTFPGGNGGPQRDASGKPATFDDFFKKKCLPQVEEITSHYGPIAVVWFDTPGNMPRKYVEQLVAVVRKNQPMALVSGRAGHGLGDYKSLGDMAVPAANVDGMWESVDTTNDSWGYAWYDENWKSPCEILHRLISCVARGGTYMLNIGPRPDGTVPERAARSLRSAGAWIQRYPQVVYGVDASPWQHALPWGDVTLKGKRLFLSVFDWPDTGVLWLPGLATDIHSARLLGKDDGQPVSFKKDQGWVRFELPPSPPDRPIAVVEVNLTDEPKVDPTLGIDPGMTTELLAEFAQVTGAKRAEERWMEKFGEWKHTVRIHKWTPEARATWRVRVREPGDYDVDLTYAGDGRLVWGVTVEGGQHIQNQQAATPKYQGYDIGWINFPKPGVYEVSVSCLEGDVASASLKSMRFRRIRF